MSRLARLQFVGPLALLLAALAAEAAAFALAQAPSSSFLWYLNLEVFSVFRRTRVLFGDYAALPFAQVLIIGGLPALIAFAGLALRQNLMVAVGSNLSLVAAGAVLYASHHWQSAGQVQAASLAHVHVPTGTGVYLLAVLLFACLLSFAASHFFYLQAVRAQR